MICKNIGCNKNRWKYRMKWMQYQKHWKLSHPTNKSPKYQIVSHLTLGLNKKKYLNEYKLININNNKYLPPIQSQSNEQKSNEQEFVLFFFDDVQYLVQ